MAFISRSQLEQQSTPLVGSTTGDRLGLVLLATIYVKVFFTFSPFRHSLNATESSGESSGGGSLTTQLYWLGILAFAAFIIWRNWGTAMLLLRRTWIYFLPLAWFAVTLLWSPDVDVTLRRTVLIFFMAGVAFGVAAARPSPTDFLHVSALVIGFIMLLSVLSVIALPGLARSGGGQFLGIYQHKNGAGYVAGITVIFWIFLVVSSIRFEMKMIALFGSLLWLFFLVGTASKTSLGLALLTPMIGIGLYYALQLNLQWRVMAYVAGGVFLGIVAWTMLFVDWTIEDLGVLIFEDLTFTNRTNVWEYVIMSIEERPFIGYGYGAFWKTEDGLSNRLGAEMSAGWAATAGSAHNGYLNIWLESGIIGLLACVSVIVIVFHGCLDLMKRPGQPALDRWVYASVFSLVLFLVVRDMMETSLYKGHAGSTMLFFMASYLVPLWRWQTDEQPFYREPEAPRMALAPAMRRRS
jgi:O-antigen ligase